jgi:hypothetical protein
MESPQVNSELWVNAAGLHAHAGWCESLAGKLAGNSAPTSAGSSELASAGAVSACHTQVAAAGVRCTLRMQTTATALGAAAAGYAENEAGSAAQLRAIATPMAD